jgi:hypothetical protein
MTLLVGSVEPLPVAFFPPVVFAIAIPPLLDTGQLLGIARPMTPERYFELPPGKNKNKPLKTFYYSTLRNNHPGAFLPYSPS